MKQLTLAAVGFERYAKTTRRAAFLAEMERVVSWSAWCALIEPFYPKPGNGRPPVGSSGCCASISCSTGSIYPIRRSKRRFTISQAMRRFVRIDLGREPVPDETTVCRFRHLLDEHDLGRRPLEEVQRTWPRRD